MRSILKIKPTKFYFAILHSLITKKCANTRKDVKMLLLIFFSQNMYRKVPSD